MNNESGNAHCIAVLYCDIIILFIVFLRNRQTYPYKDFAFDKNRTRNIQFNCFVYAATSIFRRSY